MYCQSVLGANLIWGGNAILAVAPNDHISVGLPHLIWIWASGLRKIGVPIGSLSKRIGRPQVQCSRSRQLDIREAYFLICTIVDKYIAWLDIYRKIVRSILLQS